MCDKVSGIVSFLVRRGPTEQMKVNEERTFTVYIGILLFEGFGSVLETLSQEAVATLLACEGYRDMAACKWDFINRYTNAIANAILQNAKEITGRYSDENHDAVETAIRQIGMTLGEYARDVKCGRWSYVTDWISDDGLQEIINTTFRANKLIGTDTGDAPIQLIRQVDHHDNE